MDELVELRGAPRRPQQDNGGEFISAALKEWAQQQGVELVHNQPGKPPTQNAYFERFNRPCRTEVLDRYVLTALGDGEERRRYNQQRPHRSQGGLTPIHYAMAQSPSSSPFEFLERTRTLHHQPQTTIP